MKTILVIAPHFDDCEFGVGGYIAKIKEKDDDCQVVVAVMCNGSYTVSHSQEVLTPEGRYQEAEKACQVLGVDRLISLYLGEDNSLLQADFGKMVPAIDRLIEEEMPDVMFIPLPSCNPDHEATYKVCMAALRPQRGHEFKVYAYEYPISNWGVGAPQYEIMGRTYVRLSEQQLVTKINSIQAYSSQVAGREDTLAGVAGAAALARVRGLECGSEFAELLYLIRNVA